MRVQKNAEDIRQFCEGINLPNMWEYVHATEINDCETFYDLTDLLTENGYFDVEIIYHSNAMKYLTDNDPSLTRAFAIASEYGLDVKNLNSERLASMVASEDLIDFYYSKREEIEEFLQS